MVTELAESAGAISHYRLLEPLGRGYMALHWLANCCEMLGRTEER